jgi:hypothetical protein
MLQKLVFLAICSNTVIEHMPHHPKVNGSSLAVAAGTG